MALSESHLKSIRDIVAPEFQSQAIEMSEDQAKAQELHAKQPQHDSGDLYRIFRFIRLEPYERLYRSIHRSGKIPAR